MTDQEEPTERRTEGVRIIGAQEAAEAAARPDVVRRRRRSEKKFGDRPDTPEVDSDLPKIKISTSESTNEPGATFGAVPVVRPSAEPQGDDPSDQRSSDDSGERWADGRPRLGHARILDPQPAGPPDEPQANDLQAFDPPAGQASDPQAENPTDSDAASEERVTPSKDTPADASAVTSRRSTEPVAAAQSDPAAPKETPVPQQEDESWEDTRGWDELLSSDSTRDMDDDDSWEIDEPLLGGGDLDLEDSDPLGTPSGEDSFVLPHWTEPPTGQVPKVVSGTDPFEDPSPSAELPRWRDEGERTGVTDFTDLADAGSRFGALGDPGYDDEEDDDLFDDDFMEDDPDETATGEFSDFFDDEDEPRDEHDLEEVLDPKPRRHRPVQRERDDDTSSKSGGDRNLVSAVGVGLALVAVGLFCFWLGGLATTLLVAVILVVASVELLTTLDSRRITAPKALAVPAVLGLLLGTYFSGVDAYPVVLGLTVISAMLWYLWITPHAKVTRDLGATLLVVMWVGFLGSFATLMLGIGRQMQSLDSSLKSNPGIGVLIAAVLVAVSHDVGAYFCGRYLGKTPLSAASPNKTIEGLAGGVITGIVVPLIVVGLFHIHPVGATLPKTIIFAVFCSVVAPLGDLCQSTIKRDLKVKDMGAALPGHGGVLDRFDAMLFVLPTAYFVSLLIGIWSLSGS